jgi:hypothetical protein
MTFDNYIFQAISFAIKETALFKRRIFGIPDCI